MIEELKARITELEHQLAESRDFAVSEAAKIRAEYERQQALLVEALRLGTSVLHEYPCGEICVCSQCEFVRARAKALAAVKPSTYVPPKPNHQVQSLIEAARCLGVAQAKGDHTQHWESAVADLSVALNAAVKFAPQDDGPDFSDGCEKDGFPSGCARMGCCGHKSPAGLTWEEAEAMRIWAGRR